MYHNFIIKPIPENHKYVAEFCKHCNQPRIRDREGNVKYLCEDGILRYYPNEDCLKKTQQDVFFEDILIVVKGMYDELYESKPTSPFLKMAENILITNLKNKK